MGASRTAIVCLLGFALSAAAPALAQEAGPEPRDCDCRARGALWRQGEEICIGGRMLVCGMDQNVSSWRTTGRGCLSAQASFTPRRI